MAEPVTELDPHFSDPEATRTDWETTQEVIGKADLWWLTTVRSDGRPHVTPLVSVWLDGAAYFAAGPEEQKAVNLAGNPQVALTTGNNEWREGLDVVIEGRAGRVTDPDRLERLAAAWREKWDGRWQFRAGDGGFQHDEGGPALVFEVRTVKILAFGKGSFSHTRHLFSDEAGP
jgi:nitroimidazol reductase NimA-like FMN-containing flavoprotein (pyridoxamine 5'-phosphate oxidase superfamily)